MEGISIEQSTSASIFSKLSSKGECLKKSDFNSKEEWNEYINNLAIFECFLLNTYSKQDSKVSNGLSAFSIARKEAIIYTQKLINYICDVAKIDKIIIDKREINYCLNFVTIKEKINPYGIYLEPKLLVKPQVVFESILYCRINQIKLVRLNIKESMEIYKTISQTKTVQNEQILKDCRDVDFTSENEPVVIYVYFKAISCQIKKHRIENVTGLIYCEKQLDPIKINICYCQECSRYFIQDTELMQYQKKYGVIFFKRFYDERYYESDFIDDSHYSNYKLHSELWLYGYNVQQGQLSSEERQNLLIYLINKKLVTKSDIIKSITQNIEQFKIRERYISAIEKWKDDLAFIQNYEIDVQRHILGKFAR